MTFGNRKQLPVGSGTKELSFDMYSNTSIDGLQLFIFVLFSGLGLQRK